MKPTLYVGTYDVYWKHLSLWGYTPKFGPQGGPNFHIGPIVRPLAAKYMHVEHGCCSRKDPAKYSVYLGPYPLQILYKGVSNMVHFNESCVFSGPYGEGFTRRGKCSYCTIEGSLQYRHWKNGGHDPPNFGVMKTQTWAIVRLACATTDDR